MLSLRDLFTMPNHYSVGSGGSVPLIPLQLPSIQFPTLYKPPLTIPQQGSSIIMAQFLPSNPGRLHDPKSNYEQTVHPQQKSPAGKSISRKLLTDKQRRQICIYHGKHRSATQKDIARRFGVDRSTVSKILSQKERYLNIEERSTEARQAEQKLISIERSPVHWIQKKRKDRSFPTKDMIRGKVHSLASKCGNTTVRETVAKPTWPKTFEQQQGFVAVRPRKNILDTDESDSPSQASPSSELVLGSALHAPTVLPPTISFMGSSSPSVPPAAHCGENRKNHQMDNCPHLNGTFLTSLGSSPDAAGEVNSTCAQISDDSLSSNPLLLPDTNLEALLNQTSLTINPMLISTEHQKEKGTTGQHPWSPKVALPGLPSPNLRPPIMFHNNAPMGSANTPQDSSSNIWTNTKSPCLHHHSQSATAVSIIPSSSPTLDEAQTALETAVNYCQNQQMRLDPSEWVLLGKLMERLNRTKGQTGTVPVDSDDSAQRLYW